MTQYEIQDNKLIYKVTGESGRISIPDCDELHISDCERVYISDLKVNKIYIINSPRTYLERMYLVSPDNKTVDIHLKDSPDCKVFDSYIKGASLAENCPRVNFTGNHVDVKEHSKEGIQYRGCEDFAIIANRVYGDFEYGNDLLQVTNLIGNTKQHDAFKWPDRDNVNYDNIPDEIKPGWTYYATTVMDGEHAGSELWFGVPLDEYTRGGIIKDNILHTSRIACLFAFRVRDVLVENNICYNSRDYHLGAEWGYNITFRNNLCIQEPGYYKGAAGGMVTSNFGDNIKILDNELRGCSITVRPWGFVQKNAIVRGNIVQKSTTGNGGRIQVMYGGLQWTDNVLIDNNICDDRIEVNGGPIYQTGQISNNIVNRLTRESSDMRFTLSIESFQGPIYGNEFTGSEHPPRDFNAGGRVTSIVDWRDNYYNGELLEELDVRFKDKPPITEVPEKPVTEEDVVDFDGS